MAPARLSRLPRTMEAILHEIATQVALVAELICVICIAVGTVEATFMSVRYIVARPLSLSLHFARRDVWVRFARWIILALEFALGADIARTAISPSWDDIGQLAAIALIRTALNYFLEKDLESFSAPKARDEAEGSSA